MKHTVSHRIPNKIRAGNMGSIGNGGYHSAWCQNMDKDGTLRTGDALAPGMDMDMLTGASQNPLRSTRKSTEESSHSIISPVRQEGRKVLDWIDPIQPLLRHMEAHVASMGKATGHIYDSTDLLGISGLVEGKIYGWNIRKPMGFPFPHQTLGASGFNFPLDQSSDWNQRHYPNVPLAKIGTSGHTQLGQGCSVWCYIGKDDDPSRSPFCCSEGA